MGNSCVRVERVTPTDQVPLQFLTIAFHGNNDFSSNKMQELLGDDSIEHSKYRFHFLYTKDLNLFHQYDNLDFDHSLTQAKLEESRFVILIGLEVIFSSSMLSLIYSIPGRYGLDRSRENIFWDRAVIVFYVGGHPDYDQVIQLAINNNSGIREVVERVGGRYTHVSQSTRKEDFLEHLEEVLIRTGDCGKTENIKMFTARKMFCEVLKLTSRLVRFICKIVYAKAPSIYAPYSHMYRSPFSTDGFRNDNKLWRIFFWSLDKLFSPWLKKIFSFVANSIKNIMNQYASLMHNPKFKIIFNLLAFFLPKQTHRIREGFILDREVFIYSNGFLFRNLLCDFE